MEHTWTSQYKRSWDIIQEDLHGSISLESDSIPGGIGSFDEMLNLRQKWLARSSGCQRGILRHVFIVVDLSRSMADKDFKPSYLELTCLYLKQFCVEFFDQNPISVLGFITTKDGIAQKLSDLSGNPLQHHKALDSLMDSSMLKGEPSLMNSLELARVSLRYLPSL